MKRQQHLTIHSFCQNYIIFLPAFSLEKVAFSRPISERLLRITSLGIISGEASVSSLVCTIKEAEIVTMASGVVVIIKVFDLLA